MKPLPIDAHIERITSLVMAGKNVVIEAEPGAGKTTRVPPALMRLFPEGEVWVLEPRRIATRLAARRVASEQGVKLGEEVGYQVRFDRKFGSKTKLRFVTEGVLTRRLATGDTLDDIAAVVLDEFHERHVDTDLAVAMLRALQRSSRPELKLVVMSATLDAEPIAEFLEAERLSVSGRAFPVEIEHLDAPSDRYLDKQVARAVKRLATSGKGLDGDVLVFLPGVGEILRAERACKDVLKNANVDVATLYGELSPELQDKAVRKGPRPKIVLSTNVAESSVTLEDVTVVIDSGLARVPSHSPFTGLPSLNLAKISQASATQRAGRAGRVRPGRCLRLYTAHDHRTRPEHDVPALLSVDLTGPLLGLYASAHQPSSFPFFERPKDVAIESATRTLELLGAIELESRALEPGEEQAHQITALGRAMSKLPLHPRLARLALSAKERGAGTRGALMAALLSERDLCQPDEDEVGRSDLLFRVERYEEAEFDRLTKQELRARGIAVGTFHAVKRAHKQLCRALHVDACSPLPLEDEEDELLRATLAAFPDRLAKRRKAHGERVVFAAGGDAKLERSVVSEDVLMVSLRARAAAGGAKISVASAVESDWVLEDLMGEIEDERALRFDKGRVFEVASLKLGIVTLEETIKNAAPSEEASALLVSAAMSHGLKHFADPKWLARFRDRLAHAARRDTSLPAPDDAFFKESLSVIAEGSVTFADLKSSGLRYGVETHLGSKRIARVKALTPEFVAIPGRQKVPVNYPAGDPFIESYLQDFFGSKVGPSIDGVPLVLHLLAPNKRAVQVTTDLAGFWERHYPSIRKELMRRYPRHAWPEDPLTAKPGWRHKRR